MKKQIPGKKFFSVVMALMFLMSLMTAIPVTAEEGVYLDTDFNTFAADTALTETSSASMPYAIMNRSHTTLQTATIVNDATNSKNALQIKVYSSSSSHNLYLGYDNSYSSLLPTGTTSHSGVFDVKFSMQASDAAIYEIGGTIILRQDDGKTTWGLYARTAQGVGNQQYYNSVRLADFASATPTDLTKIYHLQCKMTTTISGSTISRTLESVTLDDQVIWTGSQALSSLATPVFFQPVSGAGINSMLAVLLPSASGATNIYMNLYSVKYSDYVAPAATKATVTAGTAEGSIAPTDDLTFTFSEKMKDVTLASGVKLYEEIKGTSNWNERACSAGLDAATGKILTIAFDEGDLAPNTKYKIEFTDALTTDAGGTLAEDADKAYEYTTTGSGVYYINDNFSRYPLDMTTEANDLLPYAEVGGDAYDAFNTASIKAGTNTTDSVLKIYSQAGSSSNQYYVVGYKNSYMSALTTGQTSHTGIFEATFALQGYDGSIFELGSALAIRKDENASTWGIYARTGDYIGGTSLDSDYTNMVRIGDFDAVSGNMSNTYTVKAVITTNVLEDGSITRTLHSVVLNGNTIEFPDNANSIALTGLQDAREQGVYFNNGTNNANAIFAVTSNRVGNTTSGTSYMEIHSVKYSDYIKAEVSDGDAAGTKSITVTNNTGANVNGVIVLAFYNGNTLVGVTGLDTSETLENGVPKTVTRSVNAATAENSYKIMLLDSKANLKPLVGAISR